MVRKSKHKSLLRMAEGIAMLMPEIMFRLRQYAEPIPRGVVTLTLPQIKTLFSLAFVLKSSPTVSALAKCVGVTRPTMTYGVDVLEQEGLVARRRRSEDRRVVHVVVTPGGERLLHTIQEYHVRAILALLKRLSGTEREAFQRHLGALALVLRRSG